MKNPHRIKIIIILLIAISFILSYYPCYGAKNDVYVRIKDLVTVQGNNENQLIGYGLVTGLRGTGDRSKTLSSAMLQNMMRKMGIDLPDKDVSRLQTKNAAVVMITANLPSSFRSGDAIDVTVSSIGDATSIESGILLLSTLKGPDGKVYASAQGPLSVGSEGQTGRGRSKKKLVATIPNGGLICRNMDANFVRNGEITLVLKSPDFKTADQIAKAINRRHGLIAKTNGDKFVVINAQARSEDPVNLLSKIGALKVVPDNIAKVVVNERTGTVIMGANVKILPVVISHGNLTLNVSKAKQALSVPIDSEENGKKRVGMKKTFFKRMDKDKKDGLTGLQNAGDPEVAATNTAEPEVNKRLIKLGGNATVKDVIDTLNYLDIPPKDLITILKALKRAGALQATLEIL